MLVKAPGVTAIMFCNESSEKDISGGSENKLLGLYVASFEK